MKVRLLLVYLLLSGTFSFAQTVDTVFNMANNGVFTTNNFTSIGIGKDGVIWAGTSLQGLYRYDGTKWMKSSQLTNHVINDIERDSDGGIWIAQSGSSGAQSINGGLSYFPGTSDAGYTYYGVNQSKLPSRNARSLYIDTVYGNSATLMTIWSGHFGQITAGVPLSGGVGYGVKTDGTFQAIRQGLDLTLDVGAVQTIGGSKSEIWAYAPNNFGRSMILRYSATNGNYLGFWDAASMGGIVPANFQARAIYFDAKGRAWVGLGNGGGVAVYDGSNWNLINFPELFSATTSVNSNAITGDQAGNVYIGTTSGLITYSGGALNNLESFKHYTINDKLPSSNIRSIAVEPGTDNLLLATDNGIAVFKLQKAVELIGLEVTQVIQDWKNSIPLIEDKTTIVRAHVQSLNENSIPFNAKLIVKRNGVVIGKPRIARNAGSFKAPSKAKNDAEINQRRADFNTSLNFEIPRAWTTGTLEFSLENDEIKCNEIAGSTPNDCMVTVVFNKSKIVELVYVNQAWKDENGNEKKMTEGEFTNHVSQLNKTLQGIFPVSQLNISYQQGYIGTYNFSKAEAIYNSDPENKPGPYTMLYYRSNFQFRKISYLDQLIEGKKLYLSILDGPKFANPLGLADDIPGTAAAFNKFSDLRDPSTTPHEIGHLLGREHATFCMNAHTTTQKFPDENVLPSNKPSLGPVNKGINDLIFGYNSSKNQVIDPYLNYELMSYCTPAWISNYTYNAIREAINNTFKEDAKVQRNIVLLDKKKPIESSLLNIKEIKLEAKALTLNNQEAINYSLFSGLINLNNDEVDFDPVMMIVSATDLPMPKPGSYKLQLLDKDNKIVDEITFEPLEFMNEDVNKPKMASFIIPVKTNPNIKKAVVIKNSVAISEITGSNSVPTITVLYPNGGESLNENTATFKWEANDADGDALTYGVQISKDGGNTWKTLTFNLDKKEFEVALNFIGSTNDGLLRILVSDGFNVSMDESNGTFNIGNRKPEVFIAKPFENTVYTVEEAILMEGWAQDVDEGSLESTSLTWSSNLDGILGNGNYLELSTADLKPGKHIITLTATDAAGATSSSNIIIHIAQNVACNTPGATEICDGKDNDCDGLIDEDAQLTYYLDKDGDGYGDTEVTLMSCDKPDGYVLQDGDCNDANKDIYPGATELCDGKDNNCDGLVDEGLKNTYYQDSDGDGYGKTSVAIQACTKPAGYANRGGDCNDNNAAVNPGVAEICNGLDDNCDGKIDEGCVNGIYYRDADGDGFGNTADSKTGTTPPGGYIVKGGDCNDSDATIHPDATELCDGKDNNCNGQADEGVQQTFYLDGDGDGYGGATTQQSCAAPAGYVTIGGDCNDNNAAIHPGATELCNGLDDDCDGQTDEGLTQNTYYQDADGDGYGNKDASTISCNTKAPEGYVNSNTDCNDNNAAVHPGATEACDGIDNNCNGQVDEGCNQQLNTYYRDADGDGYGNPANTTTAATPPAGFVTDKTDCNDAAAAIYPGATELCDGVDDNCDGQVDEGVQKTFYKDVDKDGYGNDGETTMACAAPEGYVARGGDCDDNDGGKHPGGNKEVQAETFENATNPAGWKIYKDLWISNYKNPVLSCSESKGLVTPPIFNNARNHMVSTPAAKFSPEVKSINLQFDLFAFDGKSNLECAAAQAFIKCATRLKVYLVPAAYNTSSRPPAGIIMGESEWVTMTYGSNNISIAVQGKIDPALNYRLYVLGMTQGCTVNGAQRYVIDNVKVSEVAAGGNCDDINNSTGGTNGSPVETSSEEQLEVRALPNPSAHYFRLQVRSREAGTIQVKVVNLLGVVIETLSNWPANGAYDIGHHYRPGLYFVEVQQGKERRILKLLKR